MTWLLHQFQKVFGAFTGSRRRPDVSGRTPFGDKMAARLQQSQNLELDDSVARRVKGPTIPGSSSEDSSLRQPAARPGGMLAGPSFPTEVSELISSQPAPSPTLRSDRSADLPVPDVTSPADEQLPDIHDLLPAIEPEPSDLPSADNVSDSTPAVEPTEHIAASSEQATLFSFDIIEADALPNDVDREDAVQTAESDDDRTASGVSTDAQEGAQADTAPIEETSGDQGAWSAINIAGAQIEGQLDFSETIAPAAETATESAASEASDSETSDLEASEEQDTSVPGPVNPWPPAASPPSKQFSEPHLTKQGVVKLLFMLKPGNFHGYIAPEDGSKDILFHQKYINAEIFDTLERGSLVVATVKDMEGKIYATQVDLLQE